VTREQMGHRLAILGLLVLPFSLMTPNPLSAEGQPTPLDEIKLQVTPERLWRQVGDGDAILTARLCKPINPPCVPALAPNPIEIDFEVNFGPNNGWTASFDESNKWYPDFSCTVKALESTCTPTTVLTDDLTGTTEVVAWIDSTYRPGGVPGSDLNAELDWDERRQAPNDCVQVPQALDDPHDCTRPEEPGGEGKVADQDNTDVVAITWLPRQLDCDLSVNKQISSNGAWREQYDCYLIDPAGGNGVAGFQIDGEKLSGPNDDNGANRPLDEGFCWVNADGRCSWVFEYAQKPAVSTWCFWADVGNDFTNGDTTDFDLNGSEYDGGKCDEENVGDDGDNNLTDVLMTERSPPRMMYIDAQPELASRSIGSTTSVTVKFYDQYFNLFSGQLAANFEFFITSVSDQDGNTWGTPDKKCSTGGGSSCTITYTSTKAGVDFLCIWPSTRRVEAMWGGPGAWTTCHPSTPNGYETLYDNSADDGKPDDHIDLVRVDWY
jgi:hypothetical protein